MPPVETPLEPGVEVGPQRLVDAPPRTPRPRTLTVWERGHHPGRLVVRFSVLLAVALAALAVAFGGLGWPYDVAFVALCVGAALWVRPIDFFSVGVLPPILLGATMLVLAIVAPGSIARADDVVGQAFVSGLAHRAVGLTVAYALTLATIGLRQVAVRHHGRLRVRG